MTALQTTRGVLEQLSCHLHSINTEWPAFQVPPLWHSRFGSFMANKHGTAPFCERQPPQLSLSVAMPLRYSSGNPHRFRLHRHRLVGKPRRPCTVGKESHSHRLRCLQTARRCSHEGNKQQTSKRTSDTCRLCTKTNIKRTTSEIMRWLEYPPPPVMLESPLAVVYRHRPRLQQNRKASRAPLLNAEISFDTRFRCRKKARWYTGVAALPRSPKQSETRCAGLARTERGAPKPPRKEHLFRQDTTTTFHSNPPQDVHVETVTKPTAHLGQTLALS